MDAPLIPNHTQRTMGKEKNEVGVTGGGKFVQIGAFLFICLGLALLYPINTIISATDWFMYIYPDTANISGILSNADFVASVVRAFMSIIPIYSPPTFFSTSTKSTLTPLSPFSILFHTI